ncbi:serine protease [Roseomonas sp. 18066]|uniref:S1 family peptidase n=1 Tax=Roseomonas sp. 18066 TaxID=2681412 RepID=UPI001359FC6B|nr:serine protease [Roseomonas sp. 18066]
MRIGAAVLAALLAAAGVAMAAGGFRAAPPRLTLVETLPAGAHRSGSAFLVAPGLLVTNAHVVLPCRAQGLAVRVAGQPGPWRILAEEPAADLALLRGPAAPDDLPLALSAAARLPRGAPVLALGFPAAAGLQASQGPLRRATLTVHDPEGGRAVSFRVTDRQGQEVEVSWEDGLRYFGEDQAGRLRWRLEIDAPSAGGSSGGPLLDAAGNVVGVVYAGARGTSSAVPLADLRDFLASAGVVPRFRPPPAAGAAPDWAALRDRAAPAMRRVTC